LLIDSLIYQLNYSTIVRIIQGLDLHHKLYLVGIIILKRFFAYL